MAVQSPSLSRGTQGCSMRPPSSAAIGRLPEAATVSTGQNLTKTSAPRGASAAQPREEVATEIPPVTTQTEKATKISLDGLYLCRRRPTLPHTFACSTIGPAGLDFRVRDGNWYFPRGKITGNLRRIAAVSEPSSGERELAAEIPNAFQRGISTPIFKELEAFCSPGLKPRS